MNPIELGKFIASLRNEKNLTQEELAEKLFIDKRKISRWECGTSIPEFDMLIKLSEIFNVSLYELSICKRIENENLSRKVINKFKSFKDFNKYKTKRKLKVCLLIIFFILFIITASYTIKYQGTVEIYQLNSIDDKYYLDGNYIKTKDFYLFYIKNLEIIENNEKTYHNIFDTCDYEIYNNGVRVYHITNDAGNQFNPYRQKTTYDSTHNDNLNEIVKLLIKCPGKNKKSTIYSFDVKLIKTYDNKLF